MAGKETPIQSGNMARKRSFGPEGRKDISSPKVPNRRVTLNVGNAERSIIALGDGNHNAINVGSRREVQDAGSPVSRAESNLPKEEGPKDMSDPKVPSQNVTVNVTQCKESNIATGDETYNVINVDSQKEVQDAGSPVSRAESNLPKEGNLHKDILNRCLITLVNKIDYNSVSMYIQQNEVLDDMVLQDIRDLGKTSEKIKELIRKVQQGDVNTYRKFKECLVQAKQEFLKDMLEEQEEKAQWCTGKGDDEVISV